MNSPVTASLAASDQSACLEVADPALHQSPSGLTGVDVFGGSVANFGGRRVHGFG